MLAEALKARGQADHGRRHDAQLAASERARRKFKEDPVYRALHSAVAVLFAEQLRRDLADLHAGKETSSLAAKWAPTPKGEPDILRPFSLHVHHNSGYTTGCAW